MSKNQGIDIILDFVEGRVEIAEFEQALYNDPEVEKALSDDPNRPRGGYVGASLYRWLLEQDLRRSGSVLDIHGELRDFLHRQGVPFTPVTDADDTYAAILNALPQWLSMNEFISSELIPRSEGRRKAALTSWIRAEVKQRFRYVSRPPSWVQSPDWPIGPNGPLVFLGQVAVLDYFHDEAAVFVFHDPASGEFQTVVQVS